MKRGYLYQLALVFSLSLLIVSCQKEPVDYFIRSYTYKISGEVGLVPTAYIGTGIKMDTTWVALYPEQGQMNVVKDNNSSKLVVSWNDLTGNACSTYASVNDKIITLESNVKSAQLTDGNDKLGGGIILYSGAGELFDNMLIIKMAYVGEFNVNKISMTTVASRVECIAKSN